jgi:hypothetical protein
MLTKFGAETANDMEMALNYAESNSRHMPQLAIDICRIALEDQPENIRALKLLSRICVQLELLNPIVDIIREVLNRFKQTPKIENLKDSLQKCGREKGKESNIKSIENVIQSIISVIYSNHGDFLKEQGKIRETAEAYLNSINFDDTDAKIYEKLKIVLEHATITAREDLHLCDLKSMDRIYSFRRTFTYAEKIHAKKTIYLSRNDLNPPVFSIVSPWGPIANHNRSFPLFFHASDVLIRKRAHQIAAFDGDGYFIPSSYLPVHRPDRENPFVSEDRTLGLYRMREPSLTINEPCVIIDSCLQCFAHFMHDYLPYMLLAHAHPETKNYKIIVPSINGNEERFLTYLKIPREKVITWSELTSQIGHDKFLHFSNAYFPIHLPLPVVIEILRKEFNCSDRNKNTSNERKIFISRKPGPNIESRIENEKEISLALEQLGFETVVPELLPINEQVRLFSEARMIIGAAGSGNFSQVWAPRDAAVIILMSEENYKYAVNEVAGYQQVSACLGHMYYRLIYKSLLKTREGEAGTTEVYYKSGDCEKAIHVAAVPYRCDPREVVDLAKFVMEKQNRMVAAQ